jgi:LysM repeat protein
LGTLAQGMLESDYGNSKLAKEARNHFGIKCHSSWKGKRFYMDDDAKDECFRVYKSVYESYVDHSNFLKNNRRYAFLFDLKRTDYKGWAKGLKKAGYATNPRYPDMLIRIIEENELAKYDRMTKADLKKLGPSTKGSDATYESQPVKKTEDGKYVPVEKKGTEVKISKNKIKFVYSQPGDNTKKLADRYDLGHWQIIKYNELKRNASVPAGIPIYLQPKRNKFKPGGSHYVKKGESLWYISQLYGIKMKKLAKRNNMELNKPLKVGQKLRLK